MINSTHDLYAILQISEQASPSEIRCAYRRAALLCHPDKGGTSENFQLVVRAVEILSDDRLRHLYNLRRGKTKRRAANAGHSVQADDVKKCCHEESGSKRDNSVPQESQSRDGDSPSGKREDSTSQKIERVNQRLQDSLQRLQRALARVPVERRRDLIQALDQQIKIRLLTSMSVGVSKQKQDLQMIPVGLDSHSDSNSSASEDSSASCQVMGEAQAICDEDNKQETDVFVPHETGDCAFHAEEGSARSKNTKTSPSRGVRIVTKKDGRVTYGATARFCNLVFFTKQQSQLEMAVDQHIALMQIRRAVCRLVDLGADTIDNIHSSVEDILQNNRLCVEEIGLSVYASICIFNKIYLSSPVLQLKDVLQWRCRMVRSKCGTIEDFSALCLELLQHPERSRRFTKEEAEACLQSWNAVLKSRQAKFILSRERRVESAAKSVARNMKALSKGEASQMRNCAVEESQKRRKLDLERLKWLHRKPFKDMTMEDLQQRLPQHLRR
eukprot:TRINITY_DN16232_c0_g2_i1.p1 TRINITY_DN16232_c0_g2~~TRINITY_DN16232_c0_g2_i1.p1  ORF type:complete len:499 (-),score=78.26 TRINITY_DN16232_c0_g2_i1:90-1586(-)